MPDPSKSLDKSASVPRYKRLRSGSSLMVRTSLWLALDHLLVISNNLFFENYHRIYLKDLEEISVLKNRSRSIVIAIFLGLGSLVFLLYLLEEMRDLWGVPLGIFGFFAFMALIVFLLGPRCTMHFRTPAGRLEVPGVKRVASARKLIRSIEEAIAADQTRTEVEPT